MAKSTQPYKENGVEVSKSTLGVGDEITLSYNGLLAKDGADKVFIHVGYGETWEHKAFIQMNLEDGVFKATFMVADPGQLNISFKDSADNWDNNSNQNYSFEIKEKKAKIKKVEEAAEEEIKPVKAKKVSKKKDKDSETAVEEKVEAPKKTVKRASTSKKASKE